MNINIIRFSRVYGDRFKVNWKKKKRGFKSFIMKYVWISSDLRIENSFTIN